MLEGHSDDDIVDSEKGVGEAVVGAEVAMTASLIPAGELQEATSPALVAMAPAPALQQGMSPQAAAPARRGCWAWSL